MDKTRKYYFINSIMFLLFFLAFFAMFLYSFIEIVFLKNNDSQMLLTMLQNLGGMGICFIPFLTRKIHGLCFHPITLFLAYLYALLSLFLGEGFLFYYRYSFWDDMLHVLSGFLVSLCVIGVLDLNKPNYSMTNKIMLSVTFSLSVGLIWEIYEFTVDSIFGTNMQKSMPENELFNGGNIHEPLLGSDIEIANFYRTNYRYALLDTMSDMIECAIGAFLFLFVVLIFRAITKGKTINLFYKIDKNNKSKNNI